MTPRVVCFGEIMLRLSPPGFERLLQSPTLSATFGGGEANVAVSLAHFGVTSAYITRVPSNAIGDAAVRTLRAEGVDVQHIQRGGSRLGIYFAETGASQRASTVLYDRAQSAISEIQPGSVDWNSALTGASWLHWTGITPALSTGAAACTREAIEAARSAGARVSVDLNFRKKLWSESQAQAVMRPLVTGSDLLIANEEDLQSVLGIAVAGVNLTAGQVDPAAYRAAAEQVARDFGVARVAITLRESLSASENGWSAVLFDAASKTFTHSQHYVIRVVDRIGGGDSFAAGLLYGLIQNWAADRALRFGVAASALKHTVPGDFNRMSVSEVQQLAGGDASGRVQR
jgi:2-dehydro-3-deoxygluconokinase